MEGPGLPLQDPGASGRRKYVKARITLWICFNEGERRLELSGICVVDGSIPASVGMDESARFRTSPAELTTSFWEKNEVSDEVI